jgi:CxxC-x17-CxxC domain-containing protein
MERFKKSAGFGKDKGRPRFKKEGFGRSSFAGRDDRGGDKQMFEAVCASCHKTCEVPFRPSGDRPVYCSNCFHNNKDATEQYEHGREREPAQRFERNNFAPSMKPVADPRIDALKKQLDSISQKLDMLLRIKEKDKENDKDKENGQTLLHVIENAQSKNVEPTKKVKKNVMTVAKSAVKKKTATKKK